MRKLTTLLVALSLLFTVSAAKAEFFSDVIVTGPNGIWTDSRAYSNLNAAITAVGASQRTVVIASPQTVTSLTVPSNVTLKFERDGAIVNSGQLTINTRNIISDDHQIFKGTGDLDFTPGTTVRLSWFHNLWNAVSMTSDDTVTLVINKPITATASCTLGNNVVLKWESPGSPITASAGVVISNIRDIDAGEYLILTGAGNFRFRDGTKLKLSWFNHVRSAITYISTNNVSLISSIPSTVDYNDTIPSNISFQVNNGGIITISTGITLTISGDFNAGDYKAFDCVGTGAVAGLRESNVLWFGALADGATDDKAVFRKAFASVISGGKVIIPKRPLSYSYNNNAGLTDALVISQSTVVDIRGTIKSTSSTNGANPPYIFNITGNNVTVEGTGTIQGPGTYVVNEGTAANVPGLIRVAANDCTIRKITFVDPPENAIFAIDNTVERLTVQDCIFTGGILLAGTTSSKYYYIQVNGGKDIKIINNRSYMSAAGGAAYSTFDIYDVDGLIISGNQFTKLHAHSMYLTDVTNFNVSNNVTRYSATQANQKGVAYRLNGTQKGSFHHNVAYSSLQGFMTLYDARNCIVDHNEAYGFGYVGIEVGNGLPQIVGINENIIDSNILVASTTDTVYEGIRLLGASDTTADCTGNKIINNTIVNAGKATTSSLAPIRVQHANGSYLMRDTDVSGNKIITPFGTTGIYLNRVTESRFNFNTFKNPRTANTRPFEFLSVTNSTVMGNEARDNQGTANIDYMFYVNGTGNLNVELLDNLCVTTGNAAVLGLDNTYNFRGRGNRLSDVDRLKGVFTMNGTTSLTIANTNITSTASPIVNAITTFTITPLNAAAALVMGSAKSLYVQSKIAKTSFTVTTGDGNTVPASNHIFAYEIIQ